MDVRNFEITNQLICTNPAVPAASVAHGGGGQRTSAARSVAAGFFLGVRLADLGVRLAEGGGRTSGRHG